MSMLRSSYATWRVAWHRAVSLPADRSVVTEVLSGGSQSTVADKLTDRRSSYAIGVAQVAIPLIGLLAALAFLATPAFAQSPWWHISSDVRPANLQPGGEGSISVQAIDLGDANVRTKSETGEVTPITMTMALPEGVAVKKFLNKKGEEEPEMHFIVPGLGELGPEGPLGQSFHFCTQPSARVLRCATTAQPPSFPVSLAAMVFSYDQLEMRVAIEAEGGGASGGQGHIEVSGGEGFVCAARQGGNFSEDLCQHEVGEGEGTFVREPVGPAPSALATRPIEVASRAPAFGVEEFSQVPEAEGGRVDAQAGSHPFQLTTTLTLNQTADPRNPPALPKALSFKLPAGLVGNATAISQCTDLQFMSVTKVEDGNLCPEGSAMGVADLTIDEPGNLGLHTVLVPLFNLTPLHGEPARFGFEFLGSPVTIDTSVRSGQDYGVTATVSNITELTNFISSTVTFWGVPGAAVHDESRGWGCLGAAFWPKSVGLGGSCKRPAEPNPQPFLTLPTSCAGPFEATVEGVAWPTKADPAGASFQPFNEPLKDGFGQELELTGCNQMSFHPFIEASPDVQDASTSSGLKVDVKVPQEVSENPSGLASSSVKDITVAFPAGMTLNPSGGDGLEACGEGQVGFEAAGGKSKNGFEEFNPESEPGVRTPLFSPTLPEPLSPGLNLGAEGFCPNASKIGTVKIVSPLIANPVEGSLYLATQNQNPFGSLVAAYIVAEDPVSGFVAKLPGQVSLCQGAGESIAGEACEAPGQIVSTFLNEPQLPFEEAEIHLFGGERAPLATPAHCGAYTTHASFAPWSGNPPVSSTSTFDITSGPNGTPCPGAQLPFGPSLTGGTTSVLAGAFSPLTTTIARADGQQNMQSVQLHMPPGVSGILAGVKLCPEPQANEGTCGPESLIGETTVSAGVGSDPVTVKGGKVYLTEHYAGAPFGLSIVNPVKAGPFDLEHDTSPADPGYDPACDCLVVRARIEVDPITAALTVTTDKTGAHAIPHLIDGIPVQIKAVNVTVHRPGFTFNPTSCAQMAITGTIGSDEGASASVSTPFQVTNCKVLGFAPKFRVSTSAKTSKVDGASLSVRLTYPNAPFGSQANIAKTKVDLPKQLPSRLTTLQKACLAKNFEANPANCPAASIVGHVKVITPVLPVPLEGPAYFVSHGNEAFPSLTLVLQGYGITVDLVGSTFIKNGITSTTFRSTPDVPFSTFELTLPEGKYSALAANANLCQSKLAMPTAFVAQNGAEIHESTPISVSGCPPSRAQRLAQALNACRKRAGKRRQMCEQQARRRYGAKASAKAKPKIG